MKTKIFSIVFVYLFSNTIAFSQTVGRIPPSNGTHTMTMCFAGLTKGEISINELLSDSLHFTNSYIDSITVIKSFHLTITCKGQVLKYLENNSGNSLTTEMKEAVSKFHSGCNIIFDGIKTSMKLGDEYSHHRMEDWPGPVRLTLK